MPQKPNYQRTIYACFTGYLVQAAINNFAPLLFLTFQKSYDISLSRITLLITINFLVQLGVDLAAAGFVDRIGYRTSMLLANIFAGVGLISLAFLPDLLPDPYVGLVTAVVIYAIGGGLIEVLVSPIMESCPTDNKATAMSLLHSFYCWGHVGVVLISTLFFRFAGIGNWKIMAVIWAMLPLLDFILFFSAPIAPLIEEGETGMTMKELFAQKIFWVLLILMACSGASEQAVSQWASTFAEEALGVTKTIGDLAGPMFFAILMGLSRAFYGKYGERIDLDRFMLGSCILCIISYLMISLVPNPVISLIGCGLTGLSVGILWPGSFSKASASLRSGGTAMFALLALGGDLGCSGGPTVVGMVSSALNDNLKAGILAAIVFPFAMICGILLLKKFQKTAAA